MYDQARICKETAIIYCGEMRHYKRKMEEAEFDRDHYMELKEILEDTISGICWYISIVYFVSIKLNKTICFLIEYKEHMDTTNQC